MDVTGLEILQLPVRNAMTHETRVYQRTFPIFMIYPAHGGCKRCNRIAHLRVNDLIEKQYIRRKYGRHNFTVCIMRRMKSVLMIFMIYISTLAG